MFRCHLIAQHVIHLYINDTDGIRLVVMWNLATGNTTVLVFICVAVKHMKLQINSFNSNVLIGFVSL